MADVMDIPKGFKQTEVGVIPEDWEVKELFELSKMKSGETITSKQINELDTYPCYGGNGLRGYTHRFTHNGGFALIGRQGALCGNVQYFYGKFFASEHAVVVTPKPKTDIKWFYYVLSDMNLNQYSESSAQPGLSVSKILKLSIPTPSTKSEQTAIAEVLTDADTLIAQLERLIAKKQVIKQGAMQELLKPKDDWIVKKLRYVVHTFVNGGTPSTSVDKYWKGNIPWISGADILNQRIDKIRRYITEEAVKKSSTNVIEKGNLLFVSRTGVGKLAIVPFDIAISQDFTGIYVNKSCLVADYLYRYFDSISKELQTQNQGTSIKGITRETLSNFPIPLPRLEEQTRIARILSDMDAEIETLERKLEKYKRIKQGMMQVLLTGRIRLV